ncbi:MAG: hypothetical protein O7E55_03140 [Chloroflexi bacterium]|nr:hypothetical protein [Chloroflexota bacterium]
MKIGLGSPFHTKLQNGLMDKRLNWIFDLFWPRLTGNPECPPCDKSLNVSQSNIQLLSVIDAELKERTSQAEERIRTVDAKLIVLLSLASVLSGILISAVTIVLIGTLDNIATAHFIILLTLIPYVIVQLLNSLLSTVSGLERKSYKQLSRQDMDPLAKDNPSDYHLRIINLKNNYLWWNEWVVNQKVSWMAVAHTALRNALFGATVLAILTVIAAITRRW